MPQSLTYLVDDVSRRFGTLRAGHAEAFLRSDDETALTELLHAPGADALRLRRIAPTVVISDVPLGTLLPRIRELGLAPVVEAVDGTVRVARPDCSAHAHAVVVHPRRPGSEGCPHRRRRLGDPLRRPLLRLPTSSRRLCLEAGRRDRDAAAGRGVRRQLRIGYVGNDGTVIERLVSPERVEGGRVTAYDERSDSSRTFAIHRITAVSRP